ncbi:MAG TPA: glycosyltransferase family 2 protein [Planctomycetaceae bacterium]|jgi:glycosyltransferase involved in cell wall biosynthesis
MSLTIPINVPAVSVVIPTHNRAKYLPQTLESVFSQQLGGLAIETIVVDDCSTDQTHQVLAAYADKIHMHRLETNQGAGAARNEGLQHATGKYVKFLDSDDVLCPDALAEELRLAEENAADMVISGWGNVQIDDRLVAIPGTERLSPPPEMLPLPDTVLMGRAAPTSAVLYRRGYIAGLWWDASIRCPDDWHFFCQAALRYGKIATRPSPAYWLRNHAGPRASIAGMLTYARGHHAVLRLIEETLAAQELLTQERKQRLAQYYYKQIYVFAMNDVEAFNRAAAHILDLDPGFQPVAHEQKWYMRSLARLVGFRRAVLLYTAAKRRLRG